LPCSRSRRSPRRRRAGPHARCVSSSRLRAGAGTDVVARTVTQKAADFLGQQIVAENRTGAAGNLGAEAAAKAPADGYTLAILSTIHAANQSFYRKLGYSMANDFVPIVEIGVSPTLWVVRAGRASSRRSRRRTRRGCRNCLTYR
jgi:tripartite-type tricarboxylate transporter receptor subunit TctC